MKENVSKKLIRHYTAVAQHASHPGCIRGEKQRGIEKHLEEDICLFHFYKIKFQISYFSKTKEGQF